MEISNAFNPKGVLRLDFYDTDGNVVDCWEDRNLIVQGGRDAVASLIGAGTAGKVVNRISVGTNGSGTLLTDTAITSPFEKNLSGTTYPTGSVQFSFSIETSEANGMTIREFGLLCTDDTLFARIVRAPIVKDNTIRIEGTWTITF